MNVLVLGCCSSAWAKLFPEATVLAPQDQVAGSHVEINGTLADSADLLRKYHVVEAIDTSRFHRYLYTQVHLFAVLNFDFAARMIAA